MRMIYVEKSATVVFHDVTTGEVRQQFKLSPGFHALASFARFRPSGAAMTIEGGVRVHDQGNAQTCLPVGQFDSAANPHFRVTPFQRQARKLATMMERNNALAARAEKALKATQRALAVPALAAPSPGDAVELPPG